MDEKIELYEDIYDKKFSFGKNWKEYLKGLDKKKIDLAKKSLQDFTQLESFKGKTFVDIGCGSGLFSLCAVLLGAKKVVSVDIDKNSLNCALYLRKKFKIEEKIWVVKKGSALDLDILKSLGKFDIVYSWGVLHHTGNMWKALDNVTILTKKDSLLYIAIYNDYDGFPSSKLWWKIKKFYSGTNRFIQIFFENIFISKIILMRLIRGKNPYKYIKNYDLISVRGMSFYRDVVDWLGGYPYEYASVTKVKSFFSKRDFYLVNLNKITGTGCNEFLFKNGK